jgi:hypothetical protein
MPDIIYGLVNSVIDETSFIMTVTEGNNSNQYNYKNWECIKIANISSSAMEQHGSYLDKFRLTRTIKNKKVCCSVQSRDKFGRVVADVKVI